MKRKFSPCPIDDVNADSGGTDTYLATCTGKHFPPTAGGLKLETHDDRNSRQARSYLILSIHIFYWFSQKTCSGHRTFVFEHKETFWRLQVEMINRTYVLRSPCYESYTLPARSEDASFERAPREHLRNAVRLPMRIRSSKTCSYHCSLIVMIHLFRLN